MKNAHLTLLFNLVLIAAFALSACAPTPQTIVLPTNSPDFFELKDGDMVEVDLPDFNQQSKTNTWRFIFSGGNITPLEAPAGTTFPCRGETLAPGMVNVVCDGCFAFDLLVPNLIGTYSYNVRIIRK